MLDNARLGTNSPSWSIEGRAARRTAFLVVAIVLGVFGRPGFAQDIVVLDGKSLTIDDLEHVARDGAKVEISAEALDRVTRSHELLVTAATEKHAIYGMTRGVGENKDKTVKYVPDTSREFNHRLLRSHGAGVGPFLPERMVRAVLVARLNTMLLGRSGCRPEVVETYRDFLNHRIHPVLPSRGSIGQADITVLPHVGLAMMGEWQVDYDGERMTSREALLAAGLEPLVPCDKDALAIVSSNALSAGIGALLLHEARELLDAADVVFCLSLEGLNGNVAPLLEVVQVTRPYPAQVRSAGRMRGHLEGSYLWNEVEGVERALQDPLCFRTASQVHAAVRDQIEYLEDMIVVQLNSSDDNPAVILGDVNELLQFDAATPIANEQIEGRLGAGAWFKDDGDVTGIVVPTANFEPTSWALGFETLNVALSHVSRSSCYRMIRLGTESFTGLSRFLAPNGDTIAFSTIEKTYTSLDTEIRALSRPISADYLELAGGIEDHATNAPLIVNHLSRIIDNLRYIVGMELMYASQAISLRRRDEKGAGTLGAVTGPVFERYREVVPFLERDRLLTRDIRKSYLFIRDARINETIGVVEGARDADEKK